MSQPDFGNEQAKRIPVTYDFGRLLKERPHIYRITQLSRAGLGYLHLSLEARVAFFAEYVFSQIISIRCITAVDYSIRPANPGIIEGGPCIEYYETHERLETVSRAVPNTDGMEVFKPTVKFTLLNIDQSYIIAERFVMSILSDGVTGWSGWTHEQQQQRTQSLKQTLDSIDKYRIRD